MNDIIIRISDTADLPMDITLKKNSFGVMNTCALMNLLSRQITRLTKKRT